MTKEAYRATEAVEFIAEHLQNEDKYIQVRDKYKQVKDKYKQIKDKYKQVKDKYIQVKDKKPKCIRHSTCSRALFQLMSEMKNGELL